MTYMRSDLDQISNKLEVHLHQLASSIDESGKDDEEAVDLLVVIEEVLKFLPALVLVNYFDVFDSGIEEEDEAIKHKVFVIAISLIAVLIEM